MKKVAIVGLFWPLMVAGQGFAAFSIDGIHHASKIATDAFRVANPSHVEHFTGYKAWKSADDVKVKLYVNHDGMIMEFNYTCHQHDDAIECHAQ